MIKMVFFYIYYYYYHSNNNCNNRDVTTSKVSEQLTKLSQNLTDHVEKAGSVVSVG